MKDIKMTNVCTGQWYKYLCVLVDKLIVRKQHIIMVTTTLVYLKKSKHFSQRIGQTTKTQFLITKS